MFSFATSPGSVKGTVYLLSVAGDLAGLAPARAVVDDPIRQRPLEADVMPGLLRLNPLVPQNLFAFGETRGKARSFLTNRSLLLRLS
jgi:hypothetical protein